MGIPPGYIPTCLFCRVGIYPYPPTRLVYLYSGFGYIEKSGVKRGDDVKEPARRASCRVFTINSVVCIASECYVVLLKMSTKYMHTYNQVPTGNAPGVAVGTPKMGLWVCVSYLYL